MSLQPGIFIKSTHALDNTVFEAVTIFITEYNDAGAMGFVVNRLFDRSFNELEEFKQTCYFPMYEGGPVDHEHLYFLHRRPELIAAGSMVSMGVYLGGNLAQAVAGINSYTLSTKDVKILVGYCGWDKGELEVEIEEGSWVLASGEADDVFSMNE